MTDKLRLWEVGRRRRYGLKTVRLTKEITKEMRVVMVAEVGKEGGKVGLAGVLSVDEGSWGARRD